MLLRLRGLVQGFVDTFLRDNKVLPVVLALLVLLVFAWVVAGIFVGGPDGERVANQANVAQSQNVPPPDPVAPEAENRDVDSYAAYRSKDPFRQLLAPAEETSAQPTGETTEPPVEDTGGTSGTDGSGSTTGDATGGGGDRSQDTDNDGLTDSREAALAQDPRNPDTDGDGIPDGADDADGDGQPDGRVTGGGSDAASPTTSPDASASPGAGSGTNSGDGGGQGGGGGGRKPGRGDDLLDSGGSLYAP